jgi:hypothetical protein
MAAAAGHRAKPSPKILFLSNEHLKIGVDAAAGGGIAHISSPKNGKNVLNAYDLGRYIQQSYYGKEDGSNWNGQPWRWNPVQCGKLHHHRACKHHLGLYRHHNVLE